jgi:uncharacterized protein
MSAKVQVDREAIADFCRRWGVTELDLFGSVLRDDFGPHSDIDVLVSFAPGARPTLADLLCMEAELETLFGRRVDLVQRHLVERSENYILREHVLRHHEPLYVA